MTTKGTHFCPVTQLQFHSILSHEPLKHSFNWINPGLDTARFHRTAPTVLLLEFLQTTKIIIQDHCIFKSVWKFLPARPREVFRNLPLLLVLCHGFPCF